LREHSAMRHAAYQFRHRWQSHWGLYAGLFTGAMFMTVQWASPHVGGECGRLGQVEEEWRIGLPARHVMCVATTDGDLVYDRFVMPEKPVRQTASLIQ
jgi:hypothetical protein